MSEKISNSMIIAINEIKSRLDKNAPLEDRLRKAMREALNHWLITNENEQFNCAVAAVLLTASEKERARISVEMKFLKALNVSSENVPVNWELLMDELEGQEPIGLLPLWRSIKEEEKR